MGHHYTDQEIVKKIKHDDGQAFKYLVDEMLPAITYYIIRNGGNEEDAKDIFQDGLFVLIEKIKSGQFVLVSSLSTYIFAICKNLWGIVLDKRKAARHYQLKTATFVPDDDESDRSDSAFYDQIFMNSFHQLDEQCQVILRMYWTEVPAERIATLLEFSYGYLRKRKSECMKELKRRIMNHPDYQEIERNLSLK